MNVSFVRATPAEIGLRLMDVVRDGVGGGARVPERHVVVHASERDLARAYVEQAHLDLERVAGAPHRAFDDAVGAELAPAIVGDRVGRRNRLDRAVGVARNHVELALERQVVPQHLRDQLGGIGRFLVGGERDEIGDSVVRRGAGLTPNGRPDADFRCWRRRLLWLRRRLRRENRHGAEAGRRSAEVPNPVLHGCPYLMYSNSSSTGSR